MEYFDYSHPCPLFERRRKYAIKFRPFSTPIDGPRPTPFPVIFAKSRKNFISNFSFIRSRDKVPMHKIQIVEKVRIR